MSALPPEDRLLSRDDFRRLALVRDGGRCVVCGAPATEVHHILERRLFTEPHEAGGYFLANAASVCNATHVLAEQTLVSPADLRRAAGIRSLVVPAALYDDGNEADEGMLTKWGDIVLADGRRSPGPLFHDPSVQRILREGGVLDLYTTRVKYPRTFHVPFSPGVGRDDRVLPDLASFAGRRVIATVKIDGESTAVYPDGFMHARSIDGAAHPSQGRARAIAAAVGPQLPAGWRISCENAAARHTITYAHLPGPLVLLSVWNASNTCLSWDETVEWAALLGLPTAPVLYDGPFDEAVLRRLWTPRDANGDEMEGWVMRTADAFAYRDFSRSVAKWVRAGHVPEHARHWRRGAIAYNRWDVPVR